MVLLIEFFFLENKGSANGYQRVVFPMNLSLLLGSKQVASAFYQFHFASHTYCLLS